MQVLAIMKYLDVLSLMGRSERIYPSGGSDFRSLSHSEKVLHVGLSGPKALRGQTAGGLSKYPIPNNKLMLEFYYHRIPT
jgi:hypothetical protein